MAEGGSAESEDIRARALDILAEQKATSDASVKTSAEESVAVKKGKSGDRNKKKGSKVASKEKKEKDQEELRPIIVQLVNEIDDFGAGFRKPTLHDLLGTLDGVYNFVFQTMQGSSNTPILVTCSCENGKMALLLDKVSHLVVKILYPPSQKSRLQRRRTRSINNPCSRRSSLGSCLGRRSC